MSKEWFHQYYLRNRTKYIERAKARYRRYPESKHRYDSERRARLCKELKVKRRQKKISNRGSAWALWDRAKQRATKNGIPFDIKVSDIIVPETCPVFGTLLVAIGKQGGHGASPSLDRIDPIRGYTKGNIAVISRKANCIKQNASVDEIKAVANWLQCVLANQAIRNEQPPQT